MTTDLAVQLELRTSAFFASWGTSFDGMVEGFQAELATECDWDQRPMIRTRSRQSAIRFLRVCRSALALDHVDVELLSIAVVGNTVHTQRVDHLRRADGSIIASAPVAGVLTYDGDEVVAWKEYFDPITFGVKALASTVMWTGGKLLRR